MKTQLTEEECRYLLECLKYTRASYEATEYPSYELKQEQLERLSSVEEKLRQIRDTTDG